MTTHIIDHSNEEAIKERLHHAIHVEVTDLIDKANELAEFTTDVALLNHFEQLEHESQRIIDERCICVDCDHPIPDERLAALPDCCRCVDCQYMHELRLKHG